MLSIWPVSRMVLRTAEARPKSRLSTELMTALVLGEEKRANPKPRTSRAATTNGMPVPRPMNESRNNPAAEMAIPAEAR